MRKKLLMAIALLVSGVGNLWADDVFKDVTSTYLTNADFEETYTIKSGTGVSSDRAIYQPNGWAVTCSSFTTNECSALKSGDKQWSFFSSYSAAPSGSDQTYWTRLHKDGNGQRLELSQTIRIKGTYKLSAVAFRNENKGNTYIQFNSDTYRSAVSGNNTWESLSVSYTSDGTTDTKITCGAWHGNNNSNYIAGFDNVKLEWNLTQSLAGLLSEANTFLTEEGDSEGTSYTALKSAIGAADAVKESPDPSTLEDQYNALTAALDLAKNHRKPWLDAKTAAEAAIANGDYGNVVGEEKTNLQTAIAAAEPSSADDYDTAKSNLETKTSTFTGAKANYDDLVTEIAKAKALGIADDTADGFAATSTSTSATALASTKSLKESEYTFVTTNYSCPLTLAAGDWSASTVKDESTEPWDGSTGYKASNGYSSSSWECRFSQTFDLPEGDYIFKVAGRRSSNSTMWIEVKNGDTPLGTTANDYPKAATGLGINTSGATDFTTGEGHTYANGGSGYGWEWRYVKFTLAAKTTVTVAIKGSAGASSQWINFSGYQVLATSDLHVSLYEYFKALNKAIAARDLDVNANIDGKEKADLLAAINADEGLDKESKTDVDAATTALTSATTAFTADGVKTAYDNLATSISNAQGIVDASINVGNGAFQIPESAKSTLSGAITTASGIKSNSSKTYSDASTAKTTLDGAVTTYNGTILNAPVAGVQYRIKSTAAAGKSWKDKYYMMRPDESATPANGGYLTKADVAEAADYLAIAWIFTSVSDNTYKMSLIDAEGNERYLCTNIKGYGEGSATQIRTTTDDTKALVVKVVATTGTNGRWFLQNTEDDSYLGGQDEGLYSNSQNYDLAIETAAKASVGVNISAGKYATRIFPFTPTLPTAVKAYSCEASVDSKLTLVEVAEPAANTPYILYSEDGYTGDPLTGYGTATADSYPAGWLTGVYTETTVPVDSYVLQTQGGKQAFYIVDDTFTATAYRCYLTVGGGGGVKAFYLDGDETAVSSVKADELQGATIYNLAGQRVSKAQKGVYIINGKKVAVK